MLDILFFSYILIRLIGTAYSSYCIALVCSQRNDGWERAAIRSSGAISKAVDRVGVGLGLGVRHLRLNSEISKTAA